MSLAKDAGKDRTTDVDPPDTRLTCELDRFCANATNAIEVFANFDENCSCCSTALVLRLWLNDDRSSWINDGDND